jgi:Family of unknown function (DUF5681)
MESETVENAMPTGRFRPGQSGNPRGRPRKHTKQGKLVREIVASQAFALTRAAIDAALNGDKALLRALLATVLPKERATTLSLNKIETAEDISRASAKVLEEVTRGNLSVSEGADWQKMLDAYRQSLETAELEARMTALEKGSR